MANQALEAALEAGAIDVRFQPWIELGSGAVIAAEALTRSSIEPDTERLFEHARRRGLADKLSRVVQSMAIERAAAWSGALSNVSLSINLLPCELDDPAHLPWLLDAILSAGCDPRRIIVEITEDSLLTARVTLAGELARMRHSGVRIALDDFGTGYASLAYLTRLPLDIIKFDRGLVEGLVEGYRDRIVMKAMIDLARELSLKTVVEGVEDPAQLALLGSWGADFYQGFLGSAALDDDALGVFVATRNTIAA